MVQNVINGTDFSLVDWGKQSKKEGCVKRSADPLIIREFRYNVKLSFFVFRPRRGIVV
jgi:hypothetical protein